MRNNYAFIDSQNLYLSIFHLGWEIDMRRFRKYLTDKYHVRKAFIFIGYVKENTSLYQNLNESGYICIYKPTLVDRNGKIKGNCDAELVLQAMIEYENYDKAVFITGDGDFYCLINYFINKEKIEKLLIPNQKRYSFLLSKFPSENIAFVSDILKKIGFQKK